ncbi:protein of unknown function (DUF4149) [Popillia japonica]|uniref:TMEM205-like domain-containing protein n=1 Tax=Popillia japonica TaxID=7064 RepID=A0AAW1HTN4_POPJA
MCVRNNIKSNVRKLSPNSLAKNFGITQSGHEDNFRDILSESTRLTKEFFYTIDEQYSKFQESALYKILFKTAQPAHLITILAIIVIAFFMFPSEHKPHEPSKFFNFLHVMSFSMHFGAQIWMTFVSGLSLYFALPRHNFGQVQKVLFPKYFLLNSILSLITLVIYLNHHNAELFKREVLIQAVAMSICFMTELIIRLYFTPPLLVFMTIKNEMEKNAGVGMEVGKHDPGQLAKCPRYVQIHKSFRKVHMRIAMGNVLTMACTVIHLIHIANKISVL